jgi:hypothetical protein
MTAVMVGNVAIVTIFLNLFIIYVLDMRPYQEHRPKPVRHLATHCSIERSISRSNAVMSSLMQIRSHVHLL